MTDYVPSVEQLVVEVFVRDARRSKAFYERLGFEVAEDRATFVVLTVAAAWGYHRRNVVVR
jgi:catechol 2,3-dioxygenase-like lactoylglutathione lyase family enzyme